MLTVFVVVYATTKLGLAKPMMLSAVMYAAMSGSSGMRFRLHAPRKLRNLGSWGPPENSNLDQVVPA